MNATETKEMVSSLAEAIPKKTVQIFGKDVDRYSLAYLVLAVGVGDLLTTLFLVIRGATESNILMHIAFLRGPNVFAAVKLMITATVTATTYWFLSHSQEMHQKYGLILAATAIGSWGICVLNNMYIIMQYVK